MFFSQNWLKNQNPAIESAIYCEFMKIHFFSDKTANKSAFSGIQKVIFFEKNLKFVDFCLKLSLNFPNPPLNLHFYV